MNIVVVVITIRMKRHAMGPLRQKQSEDLQVLTSEGEGMSQGGILIKLRVQRTAIKL
jgi:hypothetical protein